MVTPLAIIDHARFPDEELDDLSRAQRTLGTAWDVYGVATVLIGVGPAINAGRAALSGGAAVARSATTVAGRQALRQSARSAVSSAVDGAARRVVGSGADDVLSYSQRYQQLANAPLGPTSGTRITNVMVEEARGLSKLAIERSTAAGKAAREAAFRHYRLRELQVQAVSRPSSRGVSALARSNLQSQVADAGVRAFVTRAHARAASASASRSITHARNLRTVQRAQRAAGYRGPRAAVQAEFAGTPFDALGVAGGVAQVAGTGAAVLRQLNPGTSGRGSLTRACVL